MAKLTEIEKKKIYDEMQQHLAERKLLERREQLEKAQIEFNKFILEWSAKYNVSLVPQVIIQDNPN